MKSKHIVITTLLATLLFANSASACFLSDLFKSDTKAEPASTEGK